MFRRCLLCAGFVMSVCAATISEAGSLAYEEIKNRPPRGYSLADTCEEGMGAVWAVVPPILPGQTFLQQNSLGPKISYHNNTLVAIEYQISERDISKLKEWSGLELAAGVAFDHMDIVYSRGHADFFEPHYDLRFYYVSHSEHQKYCLAQAPSQEVSQEPSQGSPREPLQGGQRGGPKEPPGSSQPPSEPPNPGKMKP